jgi:hypothetical protein
MTFHFYDVLCLTKDFNFEKIQYNFLLFFCELGVFFKWDLNSGPHAY